MTELTEATSSSRPSVATYSPTPFTNCSWPVLGDAQSGLGSFVPLVLSAAGTAEQQADPLFQDFTALRQEQASLQSAPSGHRPIHGISGEGALRERGESLAAAHGEASDADCISSIVEAEGMVPQSEHEVMVAAARESGREEGLHAAETDFNERLRELQERAGAVLDDLRNQVSENLAATERRAVELALAISRKLLGDTVTASSDYLLPLVRDAIKQAGTAEVRVIRVSPRDFEFLEKVAPEKIGIEAGGRPLIEADESIHMGCILVTSAGEVDYDLEKGWERIRSQVVGSTGGSNE